MRPLSPAPFLFCLAVSFASGPLLCAKESKKKPAPGAAPAVKTADKGEVSPPVEKTPEQLYQKAVTLLDGKNSPQNPREAVRLLTESADKGHIPSLILLSACCMEGLGTPKNTDAAVQLMAMAAQKGSADAQRRLAMFYNEGMGVNRDPGTAFFWFKKAADQGDPLALYFLGTFYSQGLTVEQDADKALELFLKAAYLNEPHAQVITAGCYAKGFGTQRDYAEAFAWALVAADNGYPETKNQLYPMMPQRALDEARPRAVTLKKKIAEKAPKTAKAAR